MNYKDKKAQLTKEFNTNQQVIMGFNQKIDTLAKRQLNIQGQLQLIIELELEDKKSTKNKK